MSKRKLDPTDISGLIDELDHSAFFRQPQPPEPTEKNPDIPISRKGENQQTIEPVIQQTGKPANQQTGKRSRFPKVTYHLCYEAVDAIEDAKRLLRREYHLKTSLEEIAEVAILTAYEDLLKNQQTSKLVNQQFSP